MSSNKKEPTTPPRTSFGIELEFIVASTDYIDPDAQLSHILPPSWCGPDTSARDAIAWLLMENGIPVFEYERYAAADENGRLVLPEKFDELVQKVSARAFDSWVLKQETLETRRIDGYDWHDVELTSPASYAIDEAFDMIRMVVHLVTNNFRCRVNSSCGFHVHLGNGRARLDLPTARNFAALWWAAEPMLSMLHPPERAFTKYSMSGRRTKVSRLAQNGTADDARRDCLDGGDGFGPHGPDFKDCDDVPKRARYHGRERLIGERPQPAKMPVRMRSDGRPVSKSIGVLPSSWEDEDDDVDWEAEDTQPFCRPKRDMARGCAQDMANTRQTDFGAPDIQVQLSSAPTADHAEQDSSSGQSVDDTDQDTSGEETGRITLLSVENDHLPRPRAPVLDKTQAATNYYEPRSADILDREDVDARNTSYGRHSCANCPWREDFWSGIKEILSCDVGTHQLACLLGSKNMTSKYMNLNWTAYLPRMLSRSLYDAGEARPSTGSPPGWEADHPYGKTDYVTLESREAVGTLDADWIVTWARVLCGLMDWCRRASPSELMRIVALCEHPERYDVVKLLQDVGLHAEAAYCEQRLQRGAEAWFDCTLLEGNRGTVLADDDSDEDDECEIIPEMCSKFGVSGVTEADMLRNGLAVLARFR
jgi:hypothetical protein